MERQHGYGYREFIYAKARDHYGTESQCVIALEELSEAQKEICKFLRGNGDIDHLAEEVELMYGIKDKVTKEMGRKVIRLAQRIQSGKKGAVE